MQAVAALAELAIPHFTTRTIFSVANLGSEAKFYANVKVLAVSCTFSAPEEPACTRSKQYDFFLTAIEIHLTHKKVCRGMHSGRHNQAST